jgi:hypothetical protein
LLRVDNDRRGKFANITSERIFLEYRSRLQVIPRYLGHRDPKHTVHYTRVAAGRFEGLWR